MSATDRLRAIARAVAGDQERSIRHAIFEWDADDLLDCAVAYGEEMVRAARRERTLDVERRDAPAPRDRRPLRERLDPERRARMDEREERSSRKFFDRLGEIIEDMTEEMHAAWTADLLDAEIAMPDGTLTTWGEATIEQHRERYAMHERNAQAGIEGAARHRRAIGDLETTGAPDLNTLIRSTAATVARQ